MVRDKKREGYFDVYTFRPFDPSKEPDRQRDLVKGEDWNNYDEVKFEFDGVDPLNPLNNNATERIWAAYFSSKLTVDRWQVIAGLRYENTEQGYVLKYYSPWAKSESQQKYGDWLPSVHIKYGIRANSNLRLSYCKAINRPSFFEILPYQMVFDDYVERGNPDLRRGIAQNIDLRYEVFPRSSEQFMVGLFYKHIKDPIEYGFVLEGATYYKPVNNGTAYNYGMEVDYIKYFNRFGIKANYTFTQSRITTVKNMVVPELDDPDRNIKVIHVKQTRQLFGQAAHVANLSLLFHAPQSGWDAQLSVSYTSDRLAIVSQFIDDDTYQSAYIPMDASLEKRLRNGITIFGKASNLLNSRMTQYVKINRQNETRDPRTAMYNGALLDRREQYWQNFTIGMKYKF
jgi:TonB-dependent receptor